MREPDTRSTMWLLSKRYPLMLNLGSTNWVRGMQKFSRDFFSSSSERGMKLYVIFHTSFFPLFNNGNPREIINIKNTLEVEYIQRLISLTTNWERKISILYLSSFKLIPSYRLKILLSVSRITLACFRLK